MKKLLRLLLVILYFFFCMFLMIQPLYAEEETFSGPGSCEAYEPYITCTEYTDANQNIHARGTRLSSHQSKVSSAGTAVTVRFVSSEQMIEVSERYYIDDRLYVYDQNQKKIMEYQVRQDCVIHLPDVPEKIDGLMYAGWMSEWDDIQETYWIVPVYAEQVNHGIEYSSEEERKDLLLEAQGIHVNEPVEQCILHWVIFGIDGIIGAVFIGRLIPTFLMKEV